MIKKVLLLLISMQLISCTPSYADDDTINTASIVTDTLQATSSCIHYKVTGLCFWLHGWPFPTVSATLKLDHYLPDLVATVFTQKDNDPWFYAQRILDPVFYKAGQIEIQQKAQTNIGFGQSHDTSAKDTNDRYHEIDVIGNPALSVFHWGSIILLTQASPFKPYYSSLLDAYAWRYPALEKYYPSSWIPGLHDIGVPVLHDWGQLYPRNGFVPNLDDAKAAAVNVMRATNIITQTTQPHIYHSTSDSCGSHCDIDRVKENDEGTRFQLIYPEVQSTCMTFGHSDITSIHPWGSKYSEEGHDRYIYIVWRHYHGCVPGPGTYIGST